jgi:hypothetical protein
MGILGGILTGIAGVFTAAAVSVKLENQKDADAMQKKNEKADLA